MNAIVLVDKPAGISSAEVVRRVKSRVKPARVGHLGTLDPFATGLLPIMIGEATKLAPFIDGGDKEYAGLIRLGVETDTLDRDGAEVRRADVPAISAEKIAQVAAQFTGAIEQVPPVYSAIKRAGVPLYRLARRGDDVAPPEKRSVEIKRLDSSARRPTRFDSSRPALPAPTRDRWHAISASRRDRRASRTNSAAPATAHSRLPTRYRSQTSSQALDSGAPISA